MRTLVPLQKGPANAQACVGLGAPGFAIGAVALPPASVAPQNSVPDRSRACGATSGLNRAGFIGGPIQREDGTHGTTQQTFPRGT